MLRPFDYVAPDTLEEAVAVLQRPGKETRVLAGGTALLVALERRQSTAEVLVDLNGISGLRDLELAPLASRDQGLKIGALVSLAELMASPLIQEHYPVLAETARQMATPQVRNLATVGGNICAGLASADLMVSLLALAGEVAIAGPAGDRRVALDDFLLDSGAPALSPGEIARHVELPLPLGQATYHKLMIRRAADVPLANLAVWVQMESGHILAARVAAGASGDRPARLRAVEAALQEKRLSHTVIERAASLAAETAGQAGDWRASGTYRGKMVGVLTRRALRGLAV